MDAPLEAQLLQIQRQSIASAVEGLAVNSEIYYEAVRRAAHLAGARPEMFLLRAVFALDLTRIAVPRGGAIPLASLPNAATEAPKLRRAVPQLFSNLESSFQETMQRLIGSIDVHRQFVAWVTIEGEGLATHDLGRSVHAGAVIDALDHRPTWVGHLGGRIGSGGDNLVPPHQFTSTNDGRVVPNVSAAKQQQQLMMARQQGGQVTSSAAAGGQQNFVSSPRGIQFQQNQQQQQYNSSTSGSGSESVSAAAGGVNSPWGAAASGGNNNSSSSPAAVDYQQQPALAAQHQSGNSNVHSPPMMSPQQQQQQLYNNQQQQQQQQQQFASPSGALSFNSPPAQRLPSQQQQQQQNYQEGNNQPQGATPMRSSVSASSSAVNSTTPSVQQKAAPPIPKKLDGEALDKIDEYLNVAHMCTKASTKCIEHLGTFNIRLDELHSYTSTLNDKFDEGRAMNKDLNVGVDQLMLKLQALEKSMYHLEAPKPPAKEGEKQQEGGGAGAKKVETVSKKSQTDEVTISSSSSSSSSASPSPASTAQPSPTAAEKEKGKEASNKTEEPAVATTAAPASGPTGDDDPPALLDMSGDSPKATQPSATAAAAAGGNSNIKRPETILIDLRKEPEFALSTLSECPYCKLPGTKFCYQTGRRHETANDRVERRWKHVFRQLALASSFINTARLTKKNTITSNDAVELVFD